MEGKKGTSLSGLLPVVLLVVVGFCALQVFHYEKHDAATHRHQVNYSDPSEAFWGLPTATIDWCESNYEYSRYVAEWWNTLSSLVLMGLGLLGVIEAVRNKMEPRFIVSFVTLVIVGLGSTMFHATLVYKLQMADELPMLWGMLAWVYVLLNHDRPEPIGGSALGLCAYALFGTVAFFYLTQEYPAVFQIHTLLSAVWAVYRASGLSSALPSTPEHARAKRVFVFYYSAGLLGFACWILENAICSSLRSLPFGLPNPQLHAWWHVLMAYNCYLGPVFVMYCRGLVLRRDPTMTLLPLYIPTVLYDSQKKK